MDRRTMVAGVVAAVAIACGGPARDMLSDSMRDAGEAMEGAGRGMQRDGGGNGVAALGDAAVAAGGALRDAADALDGGPGHDGAASAQPGRSIQGTCESQLGYRAHLGPDDGNAEIRYYSEIDTGGLSAEELVGAAFVMCNWDAIGDDPTPSCEGAVTSCEHVGTYQRRKADCVVQPMLEQRDSMAVVQCGEVHEKTVSGTTSTTGGRWKSVKLVLPGGA